MLLDQRRKNLPTALPLPQSCIFQNAINVKIHRLSQDFFDPSCLLDNLIRGLFIVYFFIADFRKRIKDVRRDRTSFDD